MKLELGKKYRTKSGNTVRIICVDRHYPYFPIVALTCIHGDECVIYFTAEGRRSAAGETSDDIISEVTTIKFLKPLHEVIKDMYWSEEKQCFVKIFGKDITIRPSEFHKFGKEFKDGSYPEEWIEEREI